MKIFLDTANIEEIRKANSWGIIDGVTTNPSLIAKEGKDFKEVVEEICSIVDGPISAEVISEDTEGMIEEARDLVKIHKNIVIKIPMTAEGVKAVKILTAEDIRTNVTLVFSANQALLAAKAGATYVSPFVGRLDDQGEDGMLLIEEIMQIFSMYDISTEVIVASVRTPLHAKLAAMLGADISTIPMDVLVKMFKHTQTDVGISKFLSDWKKVTK
jgi:transaldolase